MTRPVPPPLQKGFTPLIWALYRNQMPVVLALLADPAVDIDLPAKVSCASSCVLPTLLTT